MPSRAQQAEHLRLRGAVESVVTDPVAMAALIDEVNHADLDQETSAAASGSGDAGVGARA